MREPQLLVVTGKGGTGKTTVAAALGKHLAERHRRVLIVELSADRGLARLFDKEQLSVEPAALAPRLYGVRVDSRALVEAYFTRLLRLPFLTRRLFSSVTFNAITAAAPGVTEFLILDHLLQWIEKSRLRRRAYDVVLVDGPATGHALRLLRTPRQLAGMVSGGPIGNTAKKLLTLLADHRRTQILLVSLADEMAVNETLEARTALADGLGMQLTRPVLNRVFPRRLSSEEERLVTDLISRHPEDSLLKAARLQISACHEANRHRGRLRRGFGMTPISLREVCRHQLERADLDEIGRRLGCGLQGSVREN